MDLLFEINICLATKLPKFLRNVYPLNLASLAIECFIPSLGPTT